MKKIFKTKKSKKIVIFVLAGILLIGAIFGVMSLFRKVEEKTKNISLSYAVGALTDTGTYKEQYNTIYTKDLFECQGLRVTPVFESSVTYSLYFYNYNKQFVYADKDLSGNYSEQLPLDIAYARVSIETEDDEIKWYEINGYAKQLTITVNKSQLSLAKRVANGETYFDTDKYLVEYTTIGKGTFDGVSHEFVPDETKGYMFSFNESVKDKDILVLALSPEFVNEGNYKTNYLHFYSSEFSVLAGEASHAVGLYKTADYAYVYYDVTLLTDTSDVKYAYVPAGLLLNDLNVYAIYAL